MGSKLDKHGPALGVLMVLLSAFFMLGLIALVVGVVI